MQPGLIEQLDHNRKVGLLDKVQLGPHKPHQPHPWTAQLSNFPNLSDTMTFQKGPRQSVEKSINPATDHQWPSLTGWRPCKGISESLISSTVS